MKTGILPCVRRLLVHAILLLCLALGASHAFAQVTAPTALVIYDSSSVYGGIIYAQQLTNLLSHFNATTTILPIEKYTAGKMAAYSATFYLGLVYDNPLPAAFTRDAMSTTKPLCWMGQNLWKIAWVWDGQNYNHNEAFIAKYGILYGGVDVANYPVISYKDHALERNTPDGYLHYLYPYASDAFIHATALCDDGFTAPYITQARNFWFVADNPLSYVGSKDRYLAFADLLHDILGIYHAERHRALVRIEDVAPVEDPLSLRAIADYLALAKAPFTVSVIPEYRDPFGYWTAGQAQTLKMANRPKFVSALKYMQTKGGQLLQHGYTHQANNTLNPWTGVSGDDFEFYKIGANADGGMVYQTPMPGDSITWATARVNLGKTAMTNSGLKAIGWNTPHYTASALDYKAFVKIYPLQFCRGMYFSSNDNAANSQFLQQMAPYVLQKDVFGAKRIPETMGYLDPYTYPDSTVSEMLERAEANWVVRDGFASFYYHPFLDLNLLKETVTGLKLQGYEFVAVTASMQ